MKDCRWSSAMLVLSGLALNGFLFGCSKDSAKGVGISGNVTYQGKPVTGGTITFHPKAGGPPYTAVILYDGTFVGKSVPALGEVFVTIDNSNLKGAEPAIADPTTFAKEKGENVKIDPKMLQQKEDIKVDVSKRPKYVEIPEKYAKKDQSGLTWEIKAADNPPKTFELK